MLDADEAEMVRTHINALNDEIKTLSAAHGYSVVDMYVYLDNLVSGMTFDGVDLSTKFIEGGAFSLDGLHPNSRGNAVVANEFIRVINQSYGSSLRPVSVSSYPGIYFP